MEVKERELTSSLAKAISDPNLVIKRVMVKQKTTAKVVFTYIYGC